MVLIEKYYNTGGVNINQNNYHIKRLVILFFLSVILLLGVQCYNRREMHLQIKFEKFIKEDNLSLIIYYIDPFLLTRYQVRDTFLMNQGYEYKATIPSIKLKEHIELLDQINNIALVPVKHKSYQNSRLIYIFETNKGDKILSVYMQGKNNSMFINGYEVEVNNYFYEVVMPFLPDDAVEQIHKLVKEQNS